MAPIRIHNYTPVEITVQPAVQDLETKVIVEPAVTITIKVKHLDITEKALFDRLFWRAVINEADRLVSVRRPGDELERVATSALSTASLERARRALEILEALPAAEAGVPALDAFRGLVDELRATDRFVIGEDEIRRRRLLEMTPEQRVEYDRMRESDNKAIAEFQSAALKQFVKIAPGQLEIVDEETGASTAVTNGEQLARCYGGSEPVLRQIVKAIREENELTDAQKKALRSLSASSGSSSERDRTASGASLASTAATPAASSASVTTAAATPTETTPSGPTGS